MKFIRHLLAFLCCAALLCPSCIASALAAEEGMSIVCTIFPAYDFARRLAGDTAQVRLLLPPGSESHSYEPSPRDIIDIQEADLFIYVGGESDAWVDTILDSMGADGPQAVLALMDCVTTVEEELLENVEGEVLSQSFSEGESGGLYVLTLRSHCLEDIALAVDMPG